MEIKKLSQEELKQIETIQYKTQAVTVEFGQIELLQRKLQKRRDTAALFLQEIEQEEVTLHTSLEKTYGKGTINLETGEFNSLEKE